MDTAYVIQLGTLRDDRCKYEIKRYEIEKETNDSVWVKRFGKDMSTAVRWPRRVLFSYGRYDTEEAAKKKVKLLLVEEKQSLLRRVEAVDRELGLFELQYGASGA